MTYIATAVLAGIFIFFLWYALRRGQFDDDYAPPKRILFDQSNKEQSEK